MALGQGSDQSNITQMLVAARKEAADKALEKAGERLTNQTNNIILVQISSADLIAFGKKKAESL